MKTRIALVLFAFAVALVKASPPTQTAAELHALADALADSAHRRRDALGLISAASIKLQHPDQPWRAKPKTQMTALAGAAQKPLPAVHPRSPEALLHSAREYAQDRADLLALIEDVKTAKPRGVAGGPKALTQTSLAGATDIYTENFVANEPATVLVSGTGESNLDLYVYDAQNRRVCAAERLEDIEVCRFTPAQAASYSIHVVNRGKWNNQYILRTN